MIPKKYTTNEDNIRILLYLVEDLKMKVFKGIKFEAFQLPILNSMIKIISEDTNLEPMSLEEFSKVQIDTNKRKISIVE